MIESPEEGKVVEMPRSDTDLKVLQCKVSFSVAVLDANGEVVDTTVVEGLYPEARLSSINLGKLAESIRRGEIKPVPGGQL